MPETTVFPQEHTLVVPKGKDSIVVQPTEYKGRVSIGIRVFYTDEEGELRPTSKGINLTSEQLRAMLDHLSILSEEY